MIIYRKSHFSDLLDDPGLSISTLEGSLLNFDVVLKAADWGLQNFAENRSDMDCALSSMRSVNGRHDGPQLALIHSFLVTSDPNAVMNTIICNIQVLVLLDTLDPVHLTFLFKDEPLVGSTVETVHDELTIVSHILGNVQCFDAVTVDGIDTVVLVRLEVNSLNEAH